MQVYVCTALIGDYDFLMPVRRYVYNKNWQYYCFSEKQRSLKGWNFKELPQEILSLNDFMKSRYIKFFCESIINKPGIYIYIDANVQLEKKFGDLYNEFIDSNLNLGLFAHPERSNIFEELDEAIKANQLRNNEELAKNQIKKYSNDGLFSQHSILFENNIIFKKSNSKDLDSLMNHWWTELIRWPTRDQLSLPYVIYKSNIKYLLLNLNKRVDNEYVFIHGHKENNLRDIHAYMFARRKKIFFKILLFIWQPFHNFLFKLFKL